MPNDMPFSNNELSISSETGTAIGLLPSSGARPASSKVEEIMAKLAAVRGKINGTYTDNQESMPVEIDKALQYKLKELEERAKRREIIREALLSDMTTPSSSSPCPSPTPSNSTTTASTPSSCSSIEPSLALPAPPLLPSTSSQVETTLPLPPAPDQAVEEEEAVKGVVTVPTPPPPSSPPLPILEQEEQQPVSSLPTAGANRSSNINGGMANVVEGNIEEFFSFLDKDDQIASKRPPMPRMSLNVSHQIQDTPANTFALLRRAEQQALAATSVSRPVVSNSSNSTVNKPAPLTRVNSANTRLSTGNLATTPSLSSTADTTRKLRTMRAVGTVVAVSTHRPSTAPSSSASSPASRVSSSATAAPIRGVTGTAINRPPTSTASSTATRPTTSSFTSSSRPSSNSNSSGSSTAALATRRSSREEEGAGEEAEKRGHISRPSLPKDLQKEIEDIIAYEARQEESRRRLARLSKPKAKPPGSYKIPGVPDGIPGFAGPGGIGATVAVVKFKKSVGALSSSAAASSSAASNPPSRPATTTSTSSNTPPPPPSSTSSSPSSSAGRPATSSSSSSTSPTRRSTTSVPSTTSTTSAPTTTATTQKRASFAPSSPSTTSSSSSVTGVRRTCKDSSNSNRVGGGGGSSTSRGHVPTKSIGGLYQKEDLYS